MMRESLPRPVLRIALSVWLLVTGFAAGGPAWSQEGVAPATRTLAAAGPAAPGQADEAAVTPGRVRAADAAVTPRQALEESLQFSAGSMLARVGLGLLLVFGILGSVLFLYKKATRGSLGSGTRHGIEVVTQRGVGQKSSLAVVRVAGETLLLGITPNQIRLLTPLGGGAPATAAEATSSPSQRSAPAPRQATDSMEAGAARTSARASARAFAPALAPEMGEGPLFENELAGEVRRVRQNLVSSLNRLETAER